MKIETFNKKKNLICQLQHMAFQIPPNNNPNPLGLNLNTTFTPTRYNVGMSVEVALTYSYRSGVITVIQPNRISVLMDDSQTTEFIYDDASIIICRNFTRNWQINDGVEVRWKNGM